ncbi:MAG TPA: LPS export ABC transporter permease LptF [Candidatus Acidoferrales bacterium]|nr:LPS export ABC transporter permease LptF [Candidatus Acidoferrales bacterium]
MKRKLNLYVAREILPPFGFGLLVFTLILLIVRIVRLVELVVTRGVPLSEIGKLFALLVPGFLEITMSMALLFAILLGLGRLSSDQEVLALKASGISPAQLLVPVAIIAGVVSISTLALTLWLRPAANAALKKHLYHIAKSRVETTLRESVFNNDFPKVLIYVEEAAALGNAFRGVVIVDQRDPKRTTIIFGKVGFFLPNEETQTLGLKLFDGTVHERKKGSPDFAQTQFNVYDFKFDLDEAFNLVRQKGPDPKDMPLPQLLKEIAAKDRAGRAATAERLELHRRFSFPCVPLIFGLLGVALGVLPTNPRAGRFWGFTVCLFCLLGYYALLSLFTALGQRAIVAPSLASWLPNLAVAGLAVFLFRKALSESPPSWQTLQAKLMNLAWSRKLASPAAEKF